MAAPKTTENLWPLERYDGIMTVDPTILNYRNDPMNMKTSFVALSVSFLLTLFPRADGAEPQVIVDIQDQMIVGAFSAGKWLQSSAAAKLLQPGAKFRLFTLKAELGPAKGRRIAEIGDPIPDVWNVELAPKPEEAIIGLTASWNPLPRIPRVGDNHQEVYVKAVAQFLEERGIRNPKVKITQILRIDLEGDGEDEVLISATNYFNKEEDGVPSNAAAGSYSMVLLRRVVKERVRTQLIEGDFYPKAKTFNAPMRYQIRSVLDLDGDGKLELILSSTYYEGGWTSVYRCLPNKVERVLHTGGGA